VLDDSGNDGQMMGANFVQFRRMGSDGRLGSDGNLDRGPLPKRAYEAQFNLKVGALEIAKLKEALAPLAGAASHHQRWDGDGSSLSTSPLRADSGEPERSADLGLKVPIRSGSAGASMGSPPKMDVLRLEAGPRVFGPSKRLQAGAVPTRERTVQVKHRHDGPTSPTATSPRRFDFTEALNPRDGRDFRAARGKSRATKKKHLWDLFQPPPISLPDRPKSYSSDPFEISPNHLLPPPGVHRSWSNPNTPVHVPAQSPNSSFVRKASASQPVTPSSVLDGPHHHFTHLSLASPEFNGSNAPEAFSPEPLP